MSGPPSLKPSVFTKGNYSSLKFNLEYDDNDNEWHIKETFDMDKNHKTIIVTKENIHDLKGMMCERCYEFLLDFYSRWLDDDAMGNQEKFKETVRKK